MNTKEQKIVEYLKNKYHPVGIILHGSRAVGKERAHSDWDIILLFREAPSRMKYREEVEGEDVEWKGYVLPIKNEEIILRCGAYLQFAQVLWEEDGEGTDLTHRASVEYAKGPRLSNEEKEGELLFLRHKFLGMQDNEEVSYMFLRHLSVFFNRASNLWFEILHNEFSKPFYLAIPEIKERDPEYCRHLKILSSNIANSEKIIAAERILEKFDKVTLK